MYKCCNFNSRQKKILDDISAMSKDNSPERDVIEYRGWRVIFEGRAVSNPPTGLIPKAVVVFGYEMKDGYIGITNGTDRMGIEKVIREKWVGRVTDIYFINRHFV